MCEMPANLNNLILFGKVFLTFLEKGYKFLLTAIFTSEHVFRTDENDFLTIFTNQDSARVS